MRLRLIRNIVLLVLACGLLSGCGRDAALDTYKANMDVYFQNLIELDSRINNLSTADDLDKLLEYLDQLDKATMQMAELDVPEQFSLVESLADEASENMSQAVSLYHEYSDDAAAGQEVAEAAYQYYERANLRIKYIESILHGEIPEELEIVEEDSDVQQN